MPFNSFARWHSKCRTDCIAVPVVGAAIATVAFWLNAISTTMYAIESQTHKNSFSFFAFDFIQSDQSIFLVFVLVVFIRCMHTTDTILISEIIFMFLLHFIRLNIDFCLVQMQICMSFDCWLRADLMETPMFIFHFYEIRIFFSIVVEDYALVV